MNRGSNVFIICPFFQLYSFQQRGGFEDRENKENKELVRQASKSLSKLVRCRSLSR